MEEQGVAALMLAECAARGQSARRVADPEADGLRAELRVLARAQRMRIRTARIDDVVVVARLDAQLWSDDAATMRTKLRPPS